MYDPNTGQDDGTDTAPEWHFYDNPGEPAPITEEIVRGLYDRYFPGYKFSDAEVKSHLGHPGGAQALTKYFEDQSKGYVRPQDPPKPPAAGGGGGAPAGPSGDFTPPSERWDMPGWFGDAPVFVPPTYQKPPAFQEPDYEAALNEPGYRFEADAGRRALEQSAAARGTLNGGGTLKDVSAWGQNYATTRVNDVRNRAKDAYQVNYLTQYADPYKYAYQSALDAFTGNLSKWQTMGQVGQRQNEIDWSHAYTPFNDAWNRRIQVALS